LKLEEDIEALDAIEGCSVERVRGRVREFPSQGVPATLSSTQISRAHLNIGWKLHLPQNQRPQISSQGQRNKPLQQPQKIPSRVIFLLQSWEPLDLAVPHASSTSTLHST
jgi:hypothetical protein